MGSLLEPGEAVSESKTTIDPALQKRGQQMLDMLMKVGGLGPMAMNRQGPSIAAMNPAMTGVMDSTAQASNAFGIPAVSAAQSLPTPNYSDASGLTGYNVAPMAQSQMSPEYMAMYDQIFGPQGMFAGFNKPAATRRRSDPYARNPFRGQVTDDGRRHGTFGNFTFGEER